MIIVTLKINKKETTHTFTIFSEALIFARATPVGTSFQIREGKKLLAKGKIEDLKGDYE
jgi:hypothetical protein